MFEEEFELFFWQKRYMWVSDQIGEVLAYVEQNSRIRVLYLY